MLLKYTYLNQFNYMHLFYGINEDLEIRMNPHTTLTLNLKKKNHIVHRFTFIIFVLITCY